MFNIWKEIAKPASYERTTAATPESVDTLPDCWIITSCGVISDSRQGRYNSISPPLKIVIAANAISCMAEFLPVSRLSFKDDFWNSTDGLEFVLKVRLDRPHQDKLQGCSFEAPVVEKVTTIFE